MSLSINTLLNGFGNTSSNSSYTSGLYSSLSEYSTIRTGAYKKLLNSYFSKTQSTKASQTGTNYQVKGNSTVEKKQLTEVKDAADSLYSSAAKLTDIKFN